MPWRWPLLGTYVVVMTALQMARPIWPASTPASPNQVGVFITPFRHVTERVDGASRTELGCVGDDGRFQMSPLTSSVIDVWGGSHHRKIALYNVFTDAFAVADSGVRRMLRVALCDDVDVRHSLACSGRGVVRVVTRSLAGDRRVIDATCD